MGAARSDSELGEESHRRRGGIRVGVGQVDKVQFVGGIERRGGERREKLGVVGSVCVVERVKSVFINYDVRGRRGFLSGEVASSVFSTARSQVAGSIN